LPLFLSISLQFTELSYYRSIIHGQFTGKTLFAVALDASQLIQMVSEFVNGFAAGLSNIFFDFSYFISSDVDAGEYEGTEVEELLLDVDAGKYEGTEVEELLLEWNWNLKYL